MKTKSRFEQPVAGAAFALLLAAVGGVNAQTIPKEGRFEYTACWSGTNSVIQFSKTHSASSSEFMGAIRSHTPGDLFDNLTFRCVGSSATFDGKTFGSSSCEAVDKDGDKRLTHFTTADGKTVRQDVAGTGKFEGMTTDTVVKPLGAYTPIKPGTFQGCNQQSGTYKLK